jgi:hypothetical protein
MWHRVLVLGVLVLATSNSRALAQCEFPAQLGGYLEGGQVVPPTDVSWEGLAILYLCSDRLYGTVEMSSPESITAVHLHGPALPGQNAPVVFELPLPLEGAVVVDRPLLPDQWDMIQGLGTYLDVHTVEHPDGAVRAWIVGKIAVTPSTWSIVKGLYRETQVGSNTALHPAVAGVARR